MFNKTELEMIVAMAESLIRKKDKNMIKLVEKFGDEACLDGPIERRAIASNIVRKANAALER